MNVRVCVSCGKPLPEGFDGRRRRHEECQEQYRRERFTGAGRQIHRERQATSILKNPDRYTPAQVAWAKRQIGGS